MKFLAVRNPAGFHAAGAAGTITLSAVACALTLAACGTTPAPGSTPSAASSPAPSSSAPSSSPSGPAAGAACTSAQLKITLTHTGALAGQAGGYLSFTNDGTATCQLTGWPTVVAQTAAGSATTLKHAHSTMFGAWQEASPLPVVTLRPGGSAYAVVVSDDQPAGTSANCPAPYVRLRVSPPGSSASQVVSAYLPGAKTYLPSCTAASGSPSAEASAISPRSSLPQ
jgi:Protein of unknown function (DUF4232)